jgi:outer membrane receptor for monomeric catechols
MLDQSFDGSFGIGSHNFKRGTLDFNQAADRLRRTWQRLPLQCDVDGVGNRRP